MSTNNQLNSRQTNHQTCKTSKSRKTGAQIRLSLVVVYNKPNLPQRKNIIYTTEEIVIELFHNHANVNIIPVDIATFICE
jgi:hypothetical protein